MPGCLPAPCTATVAQPVWPKGLSGWRFEGFNNPVSERTSRLSESRCCGRPAHFDGTVLYFHVAGFGPQTAPDGRPRPSLGPVQIIRGRFAVFEARVSEAALLAVQSLL